MVGGSLLGTPASSTTKTGRHDIAEILMKVALNTINQTKSLEPSYNKMDICPVSLKTLHPSYWATTKFILIVIICYFVNKQKYIGNVLQN